MYYTVFLVAVNPVATLNDRIGPTALARGRRSTNEFVSSSNWHAFTIHDFLPLPKPKIRPGVFRCQSQERMARWPKTTNGDEELILLLNFYFEFSLELVFLLQ